VPSRLVAIALQSKEGQMLAEHLISFRKEYWPDHFPIEARYYQFGAGGPSRTFTSQLLASPGALRTFQDEVSWRERALEWSFLAYYEPASP
jgi:hypothetical protein